MRLTFVAGTLFLLAAGPASAVERPYCVGSTGYQTTYITCGFATFEQCTAEALSVRGWCFPNPYYRASESPRERSSRRSQRRYDR